MCSAAVEQPLQAMVRRISVVSYDQCANEKISLVTTKNKMDNPSFINQEDIPLIHQNDDYDDYNTPTTSRIGETSFMEPNTTEATSTLQLRQKVK